MQESTAHTTAWMQEIERRRKPKPRTGMYNTYMRKAGPGEAALGLRAAIDFCSCKIYISTIHGGHRGKSAYLELPYNYSVGLRATTVRPVVLPASIFSNTPGNSSNPTVFVTILSRCFGAISLASRSHKC